jgi:hypothetical protein
MRSNKIFVFIVMLILITASSEYLVLGYGGPEGSAGALVREERLLLPGGRAGAAYFLKQVRYRDAGTGEVVRVEPEARVRRRRVSVRG